MLHLKKYFLFLLLSLNVVSITYKVYSKKLQEIDIFANGNQINFIVEVADTAKERENGLMFRDSLAQKEGMLFIFPVKKNIGIWMKNTYIPLDIIFISEKKIIQKIVSSATPMDDTVYFSDHLTKYVLEINAGLTKKLQIKKGNKVNFE
ncbi:MAG: hypothetical protein CMP24_07625 [Rickettsiales bacterium]|nr:hypothetical protein [Rickettsiales bacterium]|tara:strand:+ start:886 stop:1332 length:447 start_codon:yes stop_codon:yes gene_type:complete